MEEGAPTRSIGRNGRVCRAGLLGLVVAFLLGGLNGPGQGAPTDEASETQRRVKAESETLRDRPSGQPVGSVKQGVEVEELEREGRWVRVRLEGWVWGPSLEGFVEAEPEPAADPAARSPLDDLVPRLKRLVNERYGRFYGLAFDPELRRLTVRFRVPAIPREGLEERQRAVASEALAAGGTTLEVAVVRIETNRPDGTGPVGIEIAETPVLDLRQTAGQEQTAWRARTRFSSDGGVTWSP